MAGGTLRHGRIWPPRHTLGHHGKMLHQVAGWCVVAVRAARRTRRRVL